MSIIYDALKKVEESAGLGSKIGVDEAPKARHKNYLIYALVVGVGIVIANLFFNFFSKVPSRTYLEASKGGEVSKIALPTVNIAKETSAVEVIKPSSSVTKESPSLALNGIFYSDNQGYALINNQIVKEGDSVSGANVKVISSNEVELDYEGQVIKLSAFK